ncbi:MAG: hypothetical protein VXY77_02695 [Pseudomonadota bacterium]|nr:hypothetical protein [Pseudomonadota bacterium]
MTQIESIVIPDRVTYIEYEGVISTVMICIQRIHQARDLHKDCNGSESKRRE